MLSHTFWVSELTKLKIINESKWVGSHTARQNKQKEGLPNSDSKVHALRSFQFLLDKPSSFFSADCLSLSLLAIIRRS